MDIHKIDQKLEVLQHYKELGERLMPLLEEDERIPGTKNSVNRYLDLMVQEMDNLTKRRKLIEAHPEYSGKIPKKTPEQQRKYTQSQIQLYDRYISLGMKEEDAIRLSLDPRLAMFQKLENLAEIYNMS